ncbi:rod shape-determining protein MreC [Marinococcus luteus]|uniref:Cell shape-determining protein MreC n=1 Tax=Marinococcus luteus TaxID=1122204 RepID=A0A1H2VHT7_9BACI|nr:rod shape-determining protein MreC [Marinococcus luteus]SDW67838.1 rod shape-determining protein MreC [Marinococcus luteus]
MPHFFNNKRLIILMVSIILLVILVGFSMRERESVPWPEEFVRDSVGVFQSTISRPAHFAANRFEAVENLLDTYEENKTLKQQLEKYAATSAELENTRQENETLRESADTQEMLSDYESRRALVVYRNPDRWTQTIGINQGTQNGIEQDMAVVTNEGLIGRVAEASEFSSTVQLLSDGERTNRISASVIAGDETVNAFIEGWDEDRDGLMLRKIRSDAEIEEGQQVVTSGMGGAFPSGIPIGEVESIEPDEYGLTYNALIEPAADFSDLTYVNVLDRNIEDLSEEFPSLEEDQEQENEEEEAVDPVGEEGGGGS